MNKKKYIIIVCVICIALIRIFTPYLGRPFLIYCDNDKTRSFHLSDKVKKIELLSSHEMCIKFIRYCTELEEIEVINTGKKETLNISDISNPELKRLFIAGKCVNWSSLNKCTELNYLHVYESGFTTTEDISELKKLEMLEIINITDLSLNKLNELKNLKKLEIVCPNDIDCDNFSQLDKLETLYLGTSGKISGLDKMDSVVSLTLVHPDKEIGNDICGMDSLKELTVYDAEFSDEVESTLEKKGVVIEYN